MLTFRASNVVNLAHAAMGMYVAYVYFGLRNFDLRGADRGGDLILPVIGLPTSVHIVDRPTVFTALIISGVVAALLGAVVYGLVFRPLRDSPPLARVVASLGLFLYLQSVMQLRVTAQGASSASLPLTSLLPDGVVHIGDAVVPVASFVLAGLAVLVAIALWSVFRFTRFGLATRAAAEHEKGAILTGLSPDRLGYLNWVIAAVLAGAAVICIAGVSNKLDPTDTSLLVVPALAAALLGRLDGFAITTVAGLAIGMSQSALSTFQARTAWLPDFLPNGGLREALPVLLILVAITVRGSHLPTRESIADLRLPVSPHPRHVLGWAAILTGLALTGLLTLDAQWRLAIVVSTIATLIALSTVVITGYVGQISLAQYAFAGLAAFVTARLAVNGLAFPWAPLLGVTVAVGVGVLVGIPAVRVRGMALAVATLGAAVAIEALVFNAPTFNGITGVPRPRLFGVDFGFLAVRRCELPRCIRHPRPRGARRQHDRGGQPPPEPDGTPVVGGPQQRARRGCRRDRRDQHQAARVRSLVASRRSRGRVARLRIARTVAPAVPRRRRARDPRALLHGRDRDTERCTARRSARVRWDHDSAPGRRDR